MRLDRQLRIAGWDQQALGEARIAVFGDGDLLASLYVLSAAALGLNTIVLIAPRWDEGLLDTARRVNPRLRLSIVEGYYTHPVLEEIFGPCSVLVDLSQYGLANKLLLDRGFRRDIPVVRGFCYAEDGVQGLKVFTYRRGREWQELEEMVSPWNLPGEHFDDGVLALISSGIALEETKNILMGQKVSDEIIGYRRPRVTATGCNARVCVVGAGALGNFVGLGLAFAGIQRITFFDPDVVDATNLNRQVFLADSVGCTKAEVLCERLRRLFDIQADARVAYFRRDAPLSGYDAVFDCVDNFETRIVLSERCRDEGKVLISGGTGPEAGQVVVYDPAGGSGTPAEVLGLYGLVDRREIESYARKTAACAHRPEPSVIMVNQIIGGLMVDAWRRLVNGQGPENLFYDSKGEKRL